MASSKMLKEAIADAKAVRETAIANAKMALEEAFTPRLQSILSRKLQKEMDDSDEYGQEVNEENDTSTEIGKGDNKMPVAKSNTAQIKLDPETDKQTANLGKELDGVEVVSEGDEFGDDTEGDEFADDTDEFGGEGDGTDEFGGEGEEFGDEQDEDDLDLEAIIRELEAEADENGDGVTDDVTGATTEFEGEDGMEADDEFDPNAPAATDEFDPNADVDPNAPTEDDEIDLDEILREMGYGDDDETEEAPVEDDETEEKLAVAQNDLKEAYNTIKSLRKTINEVNLLNAKLLFANKLFRGYNLTNEQKVKVVENLDRTSTVREVKLVYSTLCESMKFTGTLKKPQSVKRTISEGLASKPQQSTAPKKEIITEGEEMAKRFQELAGITRK